MLILGFGNKAQQGKDTAAEAVENFYARRNRDLIDLYGYGRTTPQTKVGIFKFATALYKEVEDFIGEHGIENVFSGRWNVPVYANPIMGSRETQPTTEKAVSQIRIPSWVTMGDPKPVPMAKYGKHPKLLQWWGTEYRRTYFGEDYWVNKLFASIPVTMDIALISDTRFPNEANGIKQRGGYTINVTRLREDGTQYFSSDRPVDHPSEIALDGYNWDMYIKSKSAALTQETAITFAEYLKGLNR